ncbi:MAG TPA: DUF4349 domain-containing protein [Anaerolineales bacterium]|nr:DUF4349 domain-containing protein [Anaerolineales bacterium]
MKKIAFFSLLILMITLSACGLKAASVSQNSGVPEVSVGEGLGMESAPVDSYAPSAAMDRGLGNIDSSKNQIQERMVIQNVDLSIVVPDPEIKMTEIGKMAVEMGGFVVSSNLYQNERSNGSSIPEGSITIRIPAEILDEALDEIKADVVEVRNQNRIGQDVTQDYIDLNSQLHSLQAAAAQLEEIMKKAEKTDDVLNVFTQLQYYNQQIDMIKGQIQYYEQASALSAVSITLIAEATIQPIEIGGWKPEGVVRDAIQSLIEFWQGFVDFMINFFLLVVPILITILIPMYLVYLVVRAILKKRKTGKKVTPPSE